MKITNNKELIYIGTEGGEEYYLNLGEKEDSVRGWSFMGLRSATERDLRKQCREDDPSEMLGISRSEFENISNYFDYDKFADDIEENWQERHDVQATRDEDGETIYLGFGSGQDIFGYFKKHKISDFENYVRHFEDVGLKKRSFDFINKIIKERGHKSVLKMSDGEKLAEKKLFTDFFLTV
jgi:hypothetical protein